MKWPKHQNLTGGQLFISSGIYFVPATLLLVFGKNRWGFDIDLVPTWLFFTIVISLILAVYFSVHFVPLKFTLVSGTIGWSVLAITTLVILT